MKSLATASWVLAAVLGLALCVPVVSAASSQTARETSRREMMAILADFLVTMDRRTARARLQKVIEGDPTYPEATFNLALLMESDGELDAARALYARAVDLARTAPLKEQGRASIRRITSRKEATGKEAYETALGQAVAFDQAALPAFALARAMDAILLAPQRWEAYAVAGSALRKINQFQRAKEMLQHATSRAPKPAQDRLQRELADVAVDVTCAPVMARAAAAAERDDFRAAAELLSTAWRTSCSDRDEVGLAAAAALIKSGQWDRAEPILKALSQSRNVRTVGRVIALREGRRK